MTTLLVQIIIFIWKLISGSFQNIAFYLKTPLRFLSIILLCNQSCDRRIVLYYIWGSIIWSYYQHTCLLLLCVLFYTVPHNKLGSWDESPFYASLICQALTSFFNKYPHTQTPHALLSSLNYAHIRNLFDSQV